jgi:putative redox protein
MTPLAIEWTGGLAFSSSGDGPSIALASGDRAVPSPTQALAYAVMGCMGMDVVYVLEKGRHQLGGMTVRFEGTVAPEHPRRFTSMTLHFDLVTTAAAGVVERAIDLSRTKYCSVWHTIRPDVTLATSFTIRPVEQATEPDAT